MLITPANGDRIRTVNRRSRLVALVGNQIIWGVKEPTHFSKRVGDVVPGVVVRPNLVGGIFQFLK